MQERSAVECSHGERLKKLRAKLQVEWADLAIRLEISPSMCYQVARGSKNLSDLAIFRLEEAERAAGISPPESLLKPESPSLSGELFHPLKKVKISGDESARQKELQEIAAQLTEITERLKKLSRGKL